MGVTCFLYCFTCFFFIVLLAFVLSYLLLYFLTCFLYCLTCFLYCLTCFLSYLLFVLSCYSLTQDWYQRRRDGCHTVTMTYPCITYKYETANYKQPVIFAQWKGRFNITTFNLHATHWKLTLDLTLLKCLNEIIYLPFFWNSQNFHFHGYQYIKPGQTARMCRMAKSYTSYKSWSLLVSKWEVYTIRTLTIS